MHISLDSALGRQRRLNSVGESVLQIAPDAAAAYSLRSLTGGDPKVVRVRRASDNHEQDFTASDVSSGALTSFVNAQVVAPLDIQALSATGRDGDFLIAKAAYSLRSLGTRQATLAATGDTVARANGKFVVQVRRSSDDALKSFTATEVTDGTLLAFVGTGGSDNGFVKTWYDQSVTTQAGDTATGNHAVQATAASQPKIVSAGALVTVGVDFTDGKLMEFTSISAKTIVGVNQLTDTTNLSYLVGRTSEDKGVRTSGGLFLGADTGSGGTGDFNNSGGSTHVNGSQSSFSATSKNVYFGTATSGFSLTSLSTAFSASGTLRAWRGKIAEVIVYDTDQSDNRTALEANIGEAYSITGIPAYDNTVDGFVETWYDQSGNSKDAIQTTANLQPVIVAAGVFQSGLKFDTDGSSSGPDFRTPIDTTDLGTEFALIWVGNVNASQHSDGTNHTVLGNLRNVQGFSTGSIGLSVIPATGTSSIKNQQTSTGQESLEDANAITPGDFGVIFGNYDDGSVLLSVDGSTQTATFSSPVLDSTNNMGIMTAINGNNTIRYANSADGICKEVIIYASTQADNRVALETNINSHYSLF